MSDYIERDAVLRHYKDVDKSLVDSLSHAILKALTVHVEDLPAADVAPVRHGQWRLYGADKRGRGGIWMCTGCKGLYPYKNRYCPNCGAKMDGGDDK